jgi:hypothetical protein
MICAYVDFPSAIFAIFAKSKPFFRDTTMLRNHLNIMSSCALQNLNFTPIY